MVPTNHPLQLSSATATSLEFLWHEPARALFSYDHFIRECPTSILWSLLLPDNMAPHAIKILFTIIIVGTCEQGPRSRSPRLGGNCLERFMVNARNASNDTSSDLSSRVIILSRVYNIFESLFNFRPAPQVVCFCRVDYKYGTRGNIHYTLSLAQSRAYVAFCSIRQLLIPELWRTSPT